MEKKAAPAISRSDFLDYFRLVGPLRAAVSLARGEKPSHTALMGTGLQATVALGLVGLSGCKPADAVVPTLPQPTVLPTSSEVDISSLQPLIQKGFALRSDADTEMLNYHPGLDLTYADNQSVKTIRSIPDPSDRFLEAIGWLDVIRSGRYNDPRLYTCNIYTLDLLRLLLGNDVIGSNFNEATGKPGTFGRDDAGPPPGNLFFSSNNIDGWMQDFGRKNYGWRQVTTQQQLKESIQAGSIAVGVSSREYIDAERAKLRKRENDQGLDAYSLPDYVGHAFTLGDGKNCFVLSQSTENIQAQGIPYNSTTKIKVLPEAPEHQYNFWVHALPVG